MKRKSFFVVIGMLIVFLCVLLSGCGATNKAAWRNDEASTNFQKGMSASTVTEKLGQPHRKFSTNGMQVWEYKKPAEASGGKNTFMAIASYGMATGSDSVYVDILRFWIKNSRVVNIESEENVMGISLPGGMGNSSSGNKGSFD